MGGLKEITAKDLMKTNPEEVLIQAIKGMLPKGPLGRQMFGKLKVYAGADHGQEAQKPKTITINTSTK